VQVDADADEWKDVDVRRLSVEIEESLDRELHWVVSQLNNERTWTRAREQADEVLLRFWQEGKLKGAKPEEAFAIRCDRTTMTQNDLDNGRLVLLVDVAPEKPAEFVCIRIQQLTAAR
jgi:phage tail sheath protein FI